MNRLATKHGETRSAEREGTPLEGAVSEQAIRDEAYRAFEARGGRYGSPESDWLEAEKQLRAKNSAH